MQKKKKVFKLFRDNNTKKGNINIQRMQFLNL